jgi:hypothetical protein
LNEKQNVEILNYKSSIKNKSSVSLSLRFYFLFPSPKGEGARRADEVERDKRVRYNL